MEEKQLITSLNKDDENAFDAIFRKYAPNLYYFSLSMLKDEADAEEIVQDTFLVIWETRRKIDPDRNFRNYLNAIAKNKIYNVFRRRTALRYLEQTGDDIHLDNFVNENEFLFDDISEILQKSITKLAPYQKEILVLKSQNFIIADIAKLLNIAPKTVEYHLTKAYKQLRSDLYFLKDSLSIFLLLIISGL